MISYLSLLLIEKRNQGSIFLIDFILFIKQKISSSCTFAIHTKLFVSHSLTLSLSLYLFHLLIFIL
jgi:hypothetical protein